MPRFVVLLRGVNVGKGNRVPMAGFKALLEGLGYTDVSTVLNSGNAVFTSASRSQRKHEASIAVALRETMAVEAPVIVKSAADWSAVLNAVPFEPSESEQSKYLVAFAADEAALTGIAPLQDLAQAPERFIVTRAAAFLYCPAGVLQSRVGKALLGKAGERVTTRNWATVLKLAARVGDGAV
ncbi:MAG: DUF1697 domain-containing protein [Gemmataceae bacterium]